MVRTLYGVGQTSRQWKFVVAQCCNHHRQETTPLAKDPVCGMTVDPDKTRHHAEHDGTIWHFCSAGCRAKFIADPERYLASAASRAVVEPGTTWTCPMHPEIRQDHPGACPICGMALEPVMVTAEA